MKPIGSMILAAAVCAGRLLAQANEPPKVLHIVREDIKEGKSPAHAKWEEKFAQAMIKDKFPVNFLALSSVTGTSQVWFVQAHNSFASVADAMSFEGRSVDFASMDAVDGEFRTSSRALLASYRPDLSYHGAQMMDSLPKSRFFNILTIRIHFERDMEFAELGKMALDAAAKSESDQPVAVYQVVSGMPAGTYLLLEPMASLNSLDEARGRARALAQAMGESGFKKFAKGASEVIATEEPVLFAIDPRMSHVSNEFAAGDPEFWNPKPVKPGNKSKSAGKPAASK